MVNTSEFSKRLKIILEYYNLSASAFAEKINVQRSSISHLLSGRNKPSLDFVLKVLESFKEVELYWLLNGKGTFPKTKESEKRIIESKEDAHSLFSQNFEESVPITQMQDNTNSIQSDNSNSVIERIVIFYKNGTFKEYVSCD